MSVQTLIEVTEEMVERGAVALLAEEAQERLTNYYGKASLKRAREMSRRSLEAALEMRFDS